MRSTLRRIRGSSRHSASQSAEVIRAEIFSAERLEQHAESLAAAQSVTDRPVPVRPLTARLHANRKALLEAHRAIAKAIAQGGAITPAAEWLIDNYHVVEAQIRQIEDDLPPGYYRQLPKLAEGPLAGYPRVLGLAWAFVAHTDSRFDAHLLTRFVRAYQRVQPLTIGELWAIAITLRIVLVENLRRAAEQIASRRAIRQEADKLADKLLGLRIFDDDDGVMNRSVADVGGSLLVVSQFTLYGDTAKGRRPSWIAAARPEAAEPLVERVVERLRAAGATVETGRFRTDMRVELVNDGPVTLMLDVG